MFCPSCTLRVWYLYCGVLQELRQGKGNRQASHFWYRVFLNPLPLLSRQTAQHRRTQPSSRSPTAAHVSSARPIMGPKIGNERPWMQHVVIYVRVECDDRKCVDVFAWCATRQVAGRARCGLVGQRGILEASASGLKRDDLRTAMSLNRRAV